MSESKKTVFSKEEQTFIDEIEPLIKKSTMEEVDNFLIQNTLKKDYEKRLFFYLFKLGIIDIDKETIGEQLINLVHEYQTKAKAVLKENFDSPLKAATKDNSTVIDADVNRSNFWFECFCKTLKIEKSFQKDSKLVIKRILTVIELSNEELSYIQGYDRYVFLSYCLALSCLKSHPKQMPFFYAEAFTFFISEKLISFSKPGPVLDDPLNYDGFTKIDELVQKNLPKTWKCLQNNSQSAFHFAVRWRIILFADEHTIDETYLLWDTFLIASVEKFEDVFVNMAEAHISQVPITDPSIIVESLQRFRKWDVPKIVNVIHQQLNIKPKTQKKSHSKVLIIGVSISVLIIAAGTWYLYRT